MKSTKSLMAVAVTALIFFSCQKNDQDYSNQFPLEQATSASKLDPDLENLLKKSDIEKVFIKSTIKLDPISGNITLPLFKGKHNGQTVWYIVTEASDKKNSARMGVNFAPKMANALGTAAVQHAVLMNGNNGNSHPVSSGLSSNNAILDFEGTVDFSPQRIVVPGPDGFPPTQFQAGAVGDAKYSPLVTFGGGVVLNASHVANASGLHDAVISIDYNKREVTLDQFFGFYEEQKVLYLHQEGSIALVAAIEGSTFAPNLNAAPGLASNDPKTSVRSAIIPVVNGERGVNNPNRQGLQSALLGQGDPLNVTQEEPGDEFYTPVWDIHLIVWTDAAINAGKRRLLTDHDMIADLFQKGLLVSGTPNSGVANSSLNGLVALGAISNCPMSAIFKKDK